jgi:hypothetical protein
MPRLLPAPGGTSNAVRMWPAGEMQVLVVPAVMPMVPVMMPVPVVMPVAMMAVMPMPTVVTVPPVVAHLDDACVDQSGEADGRAEIGGFGRFWRLHEHAEAKS